MVETDLAWAAGFFDGEGCVSSYDRNGRREVRLVMAQTDYASLVEFQRIVGCGNIRERRLTSPLSRRRLWIWQVGGLAAAQRVQGLLRGHMRVKGVALDTAIATAAPYERRPRARTLTGARL